MVHERGHDCPYSKALKLACQAFDDIGGSLVQEEKKLDDILNEKVGLSASVFNHETQQKLKEASKFLEECKIEDVEQSAVLAKFATLVVDKIKEEQNMVKNNEKLKKFNEYLTTLSNIEQRLTKDVAYNRGIMNDTKSEFDSLFGVLDPKFDLEVPLKIEKPNDDEIIYQELLKMVNDIKAVKEKKKRLQQEFDSYNGLPPNLQEANEMIKSARVEIKELTQELEKLAVNL